MNIPNSERVKTDFIGIFKSFFWDGEIQEEEKDVSENEISSSVEISEADKKELMKALENVNKIEKNQTIQLNQDKRKNRKPVEKVKTKGIKAMESKAKEENERTIGD